MLRHVILHHHIFKNAGTSLDSALENHFGDTFQAFHDDSGVVTVECLKQFLQDRPDVAAVSSHHFHAENYSRLMHDLSCRLLNFALVRKPLARLISMYKFWERSPYDDEMTINAKTMDVRTFFRFLIDNHPHILNSWQTNIFSNHGFYARAVGQQDLERAISRYRDFSLCAPVERYDEAMVVLEYTLKPTYISKPINFAYVRQNVSAPLDGEANLARMLGTDMMGELTRLNLMDERLWDLADGELSRRIQIVPHFADRLRDFQQRCRDMSAAALG